MLAPPQRLRCEYLDNPLGIDVTRPRLSWWPSDDRPAEIQTAYRILAAANPASLHATAPEAELLWDSGRVDSARTTNIEYAGPLLASAERVYWRVCSYDSDGEASEFSEVAWFEAGLLDAADWLGDWICSSVQGGKDRGGPVPVLRKEFELPTAAEPGGDAEEADFPDPGSVGAIARARLYITSLGVYRAYLNGQRVGSDELAPGWTDYRQQLNYQVHDVAALLQPGTNALGVLLGDGWYCGSVGLTGRQCYGDRPALLAQLHVTLTTGETLCVATDTSWQWHTSEILASDLLDGESVDGRQRLGNWSQAGYPAHRWPSAESLRHETPALRAAMAPQMSVVRELNPLGEPQRRGVGLDRERWIYDFGQNLTGRVSLRVKAPAGTLLRLRYGERLDASGGIYTANLRDARATDHYTCAGDPSGEQFESVFTLHGFQYLEISGRFPRDAIVSVKAQVIATPLANTGEFACDHMLINRLQDNISWSQRAALQSVPIDAPQRDERLGWTGVAQVFAPDRRFQR